MDNNKPVTNLETYLNEQNKKIDISFLKVGNSKNNDNPTSDIIAQTKTNKPSLNIPNIQNITSITETNKTNDNLDGNMNQLENTFTLSELHTNLILISKINAGNKLTIKNNLLNIDVSSMPSFTRWLNAFDRTKCINFIQNVMKQTCNKIDEIIKDTKYNASMSEDRNIAIQRFQTELKNSIEGLLNLKMTYNKDLLTVSSIDVIIADIQNRITYIDSLLKIKF